MRDLYIVGAGGHGREILDVVEAINAVEPTWDFKGFVANDPGDAAVLDRRRTRVTLTSEELAETGAPFVLAIGDGAVRRRLDCGVLAGGESPPLVHPTSIVAPGADLADGVFVPAGCEVGESVEIGRHSTLNINVEIGRRSRLSDYATVSPGCVIGPRAQIGEAAFLGIGASVVSGTTVGAGARIGAGAVVEANVDPGSTVVGIPARAVRY